MARKEKKYHYIYKTTCIITKKFYYGMHSTDNLNDGYLGSGKRLWYSINKYGKENHKIEIIDFYENRKLLKEREKKLVNEKILKDPMCMNLKTGGDGGLVGLSKEKIFKITSAGGKATAKKLKNDSDYFKIHSAQSSMKMKKNHQEGNIKYDNFNNKRHSVKTKQKMSESSKGIGIGKENSQYGTCWVTKDGVNKKIKKDSLNDYINFGWVKGRKM